MAKRVPVLGAACSPDAAGGDPGPMGAPVPGGPAPRIALATSAGSGPAHWLQHGSKRC